MIYRPPKTFAYLRASTLKQDISPEAQRATIETQASRLGLFVDSYFEDVGESGSKRFDQRPKRPGAMRAAWTGRPPVRGQARSCVP
jgi:DNA invertase Pin-like site-specific DNA recombinase